MEQQEKKKAKGTLNSLSKYKEHNSCQRVINVSSNNFGIDEVQGIMTIPLYMFFMFLNERKATVIKKGRVPKQTKAFQQMVKFAVLN